MKVKNKSQSGLDKQDMHLLKAEKFLNNNNFLKGLIKLKHLGAVPDMDKYKMGRDNQGLSHK